MKKVTGIGGIFFKCDDPQKMKDWYANNLGLPVERFGTQFKWRDIDNPEKEGSTIWSPFKKDTKNFEREFMINYRVDNIEDLAEQLKSDGVTIVDEVTDYGEYGKFVHILDPEGNKIELWQDAG